MAPVSEPALRLQRAAQITVICGADRPAGCLSPIVLPPTPQESPPWPVITHPSAYRPCLSSGTVPTSPTTIRGCTAGLPVLAALDAAWPCSGARARFQFDRPDFPLDAVAGSHDALGRCAGENGASCCVACPRRDTEEEHVALYYGIGLHLGVPVCQEPAW